MTERKAIDFKGLVDELTKGQTEPEEGWPVIVSGKCADDALLNWLGNLDLTELGVRIWCYTDACDIGADAAPQDIALLERARLFGPAGDLEIWRKDKDFRWRYVGLAAYAPQGELLPWPGTETNPVYARECTALLWGQRPKDKSFWYDDRTAGAALTYPVSGAPERVQVYYREYTQAGRPFAIWLRGLEGYNG